MSPALEDVLTIPDFWYLFEKGKYRPGDKDEAGVICSL